MSRHFREEIAQGREVREEVAITIATAGEAVLFSGLCVVIGFAGLLLIGIPVTSSFDVGGMAVSPISGITGKIKLFFVIIVLRVFQKLPVTPPRIYQGAIHVSYTLEDAARLVRTSRTKRPGQKPEETYSKETLEKYPHEL